jgi:hypothetical protein
MMCCTVCENLQDIWSMGERNGDRLRQAANQLSFAAIDVRLRNHGHGDTALCQYISRERGR